MLDESDHESSGRAGAYRMPVDNRSKRYVEYCHDALRAYE